MNSQDGSGYSCRVPLGKMTLTQFLRVRLAEDGDHEALHQLRHDLVDPRLLALRYREHPDYRQEWA